MSTRNLAILVFAVVLGTVTAVGWYLEGERSVQAAQDTSGRRIEHVWRSYPGAATPRPRAPHQRGCRPL